MIFLTFARSLSPGDCVVFRADKRSTHPGVRAKSIRPELHGEGYRYVVDKFWIVTERRGTQLVLMTRRGKVHVVDENDPHLHRTSWLQRLMYRDRFPQPLGSSQESGIRV